MNARELQDWMRRLHIWVGLPCSVALVVFAIAGLAVTARHAPGYAPPPAVARDVPYEVAPGTGREQLAGDVHAFLALPLSRRLPNWALGSDEAGHLRMVFNTLNADHVVTVFDDEGRIRVESTPVTFGLFVDRLHTHTPPTRLSGIDPRLFLWSLYMEFSIFALIFLSLSGGYLWLATRPRHRVAQLSAALGLALLVTIVVTLGVMYRLLRNVHLVTGLLALWILLLYGLSSVQMAHWYLFPDTKQVSERTVPIAAAVGDERAFEQELRERHGVRGHLKSRLEDGGALRLHFHRPDVETDAVWLGDGTATLTETRWGLVIWPGRLHHDAGVWWDDGWMNLWGVAVILASLACGMLGVTGIYLWWRLGILRKTGSVLLVGSVVYTVGLIAAIRFA